MNNILLLCSGIIVIFLGGAIGIYLDIKKGVKEPIIFWAIGYITGGIGVMLLMMTRSS